MTKKDPYEGFTPETIAALKKRDAKHVLSDIKKRNEKRVAEREAEERAKKNPFDIKNFCKNIKFEDYPKILANIANCSNEEARGHFRNLARGDLYFLIRYGMNRPDVEKRWLFDRCREVQAAPDEHLDLWSREHYKSTIITVGKTIQDIFCSHGEDSPIEKEFTFCIFSHTRPIAKGFLRQIKREFENNPRFKEWFPDVLWDNPSSQAPTWSEDNGIVVRRKTNPKEATVEAWGLVDGQPTSKHFDGLLYDDIVTSKSVYTPEMIAKTTRELELSYNLGAHGGFRRFIGTRYSFGDSYRMLMRRGTAKPRVYAATHDGTLAGEPVLLTKDSLTKKRRDMGAYTFSCQMMQNPVADSAQKFDEAWLQYHNATIPYEGQKHRYILIDPANSKKKTSDYTVMIVVEARPDRKLYIIDMVRDRMNLTERASMLVYLHKKWKPMSGDGVRYEKYGKDGDIEAIKMYQESIGYRFDITEVGGRMSKTDRILQLVPYFETGKLILPYQMTKTDYENKEVDLIQTFREEEYLAFPQCVHDDILDCMARVIDGTNPLTFPEDALYNMKSNIVNSGSNLKDMDFEDFLL